MKLLLIDTSAFFVDFAMRAEAQGHEVRMFVAPDEQDGHRVSIGDGLVHKVPSWEGSMNWADLILVSDNCRYMKLLEGWRQRGYPIFSANLEGTSWEMDRLKGQEILEGAGIECLPCLKFSNYDQAIAHQKANMDVRYVCKPCKDVDKALSYVSKSGKDMIFMLEHWKRTIKKPCPFIFQEFCPGIEVAVGGWVGRNGFLGHFLENFEFKKLMNGEKGPNTGEMGCYDANTEVLTDSGWKYWPNVTIQDKIATLVGGKTVFATPSEVVSFQYKGPMITWKNQTLDIMVTPNHNMYVNRQHAARQGIDAYEFLQADQLTQSQYEIQRTADWEGEEHDIFTIPLKGNEFHSIEATAWARFLGLYIAEGSSSDSQVNIAQSHPGKADQAEVIMKATGLPYVRHENGFRVNRSEVARMLQPFGRAWEKFVPGYIKNASKKIITAFLEGYALGDGNIQPNGFRIFYTCNQKLSDDVQEMLLKIGRVGIVKSRGFRKERKFIDGREIIQKLPALEIIERVQKTRSWLDARDKSTEEYDGIVYCATVPGHVMYVRRNGKPFWCGNTVMKYVQLEQSLLAQQLLLPIESELIRNGYTGYIDVAVMMGTDGDRRGMLNPLEFTSRHGWPLFNIQQVLHPDVAGWMHDAVEGRDTFQPFSDIAVGVVVGMPDFPGHYLKEEQLCGFPVWGVDDSNRYNFHPFNMKLGEGIDDKGAKVPMMVSAGNCLFVMTGTGKTISQAKDRAYKNLEGLEVPNSPMYRTDIGDRLEKQLPILQKYGYCESWVF